jgi:PTS system cellobiose-specific IIA component
MNNTNTEQVLMELIANSGEGRSLTFSALEKAKKGDFNGASESLDEASLSINMAHKAQTKLLIEEANGNNSDISILMVHAQDHFMTSLLAHDLVKGVIELFEARKDD